MTMSSRDNTNFRPAPKAKKAHTPPAIPSIRKFVRRIVTIRTRSTSADESCTTLSTGRPFSVSLDQGVNNGAPSWPNRVCDGKLSNPDPAKWFDKQCFVAPPANTYGNVARGVLYGPATLGWDLSLVKNTVIREQLRVQFRFDAFNAFNTPNFGFPNTAIGAPTAGQITSTINDNRDLQLALRLEF